MRLQSTFCGTFLSYIKKLEPPNHLFKVQHNNFIIYNIIKINEHKKIHAHQKEHILLTDMRDISPHNNTANVFQ